MKVLYRNFINPVGLFSVGVLAPLYLLIQYLLVPTLFYLSGLASYDLSFLERFSEIEDHSYAIALAVGGAISFLLAFQLFPGHRRKKLLLVDWNISRAFRLAAFIFYGNILYRAFNYFSGIGVYPEGHYNNLLGPEWIGIILFTSKFQLYATIIATVAYLSATPIEQKKIQHSVFLIIGFMIFSGLITRSRTAIFAPLLCLSFVCSLMLSRGQFRKIIYFLLAFVPLAWGVKSYVRSFGELETGSSHLITGFADLFQRMSMLDNLTQVIGHFKEPVWGASIPVMFVLALGQMPDAVKQWAMEGNPDYIGGNEFGQMFGLAAPGDFNTGVALPMIGDLFLNFGWVGVILGMALFGIFAKWLQDWMAFNPSCSRVFFFAAMLPLLVNGQEHQIGIWLADIFRLTCIFFLVRFFVVKQTAPAVPAVYY